MKRQFIKIAASSFHRLLGHFIHRFAAATAWLFLSFASFRRAFSNRDFTTAICVQATINFTFL
jgi:hypothetical protein